MQEFENKVVVITGGSDGIGKSLVELFLKQGAKVATCARNTDKLYQLQQQNANKPLLVYTADIGREEDCKDFIKEVEKSFGTIDILINNAGISMHSLFKEVELSTLRNLMDTNFWGTVYCTKFSLEYIFKNKGTIVAVSSIAGFRGLPGRSGYSASKFAVNGWIESLRTELLKTGVNVLLVCPGFTSSNIRNAALNNLGISQGESLMDEGKMMTSAECAVHILKAISKRKRNLILTFIGKRAVFINKFFPSLADKLTYKFFFKNDELVK